MDKTSKRAEIIFKAAVLGWPIDHSLSPVLHGYWLNHYGISGSYQKIAVERERLEAVINNLSRDGYRGVNLTVPHKEAALHYLDSVEPLAKQVGAVNTVIVQKDGSLHGANTDVFGFTENLKQAGFKFTKNPATILGAGGAARAAIVALLAEKIPKIHILNRTFARAKALADEFGSALIPYAMGDERAFQDSQLLVNATSMGMKGSPFPKLPLHLLIPEATVMDMVYNPLKTELLQQASQAGHRSVDGLGMLLHQARPAFKAFFGVDPEVTEDLRLRVVEEL